MWKLVGRNRRFVLSFFFYLEISLVILLSKITFVRKMRTLPLGILNICIITSEWYNLQTISGTRNEQKKRACNNCQGAKTCHHIKVIPQGLSWKRYLACNSIIVHLLWCGMYLRNINPHLPIIIIKKTPRVLSVTITETITLPIAKINILNNYVFILSQ